MEDINSSNDKDDLKAKNDDLDMEKRTKDDASTEMSDKNNKTISKENDDSCEDISEAIAVSSSLIKSPVKESGDSEVDKDKIDSGVNEPQSGDGTAPPNITDTEKAEMNVSDDNKTEEISHYEDDDENLELKWDDRNTSGDTIKSDVSTEDINKKQLENEPNASDNKPHSELEIESDNNDDISEIESNLEDKLLEETNENQALDTMDIDEEELLKDESNEESVTTVDKMDNLNEINDSIDDTAVVDAATTQLNLNTDTEIVKATEELKDMSFDKSVERIAEIVEEQKQLFTARSDDDDDDDDSQENLVMDINNSEENSPVHITGTKSNHGVGKPDVMIEIPTQELIDIDDVLDSPDISNVDKSKVDDSMEIGLDTNDEVIGNDEMNDDRLESDEKADDHSKETSVTAVSEALITEEVQPSTSAANPDNAQPSTSTTIPDNLQPSIPSIITMTPDIDEEPEITDSLGLLAESSRVVDDDDDDDDDEEFEQYERSHQLNAEFSDDSDDTPVESDTAKDDQEKKMEEELAEESLRLNWEEEDSSRKALRAELHEEIDLKIEEENDDGENVQPLLPDLKVGNTEIGEEMKIKEEKEDGVPIETLPNKEKEDIFASDRVEKQKEVNEKETERTDVLNKEGDVEMVEIEGVLKKIKVEKEDVPSRIRVQKDDEISSRVRTVSFDASSVDSDDLTMQAIEIETVKLSDDDDDEEVEEIPQKVYQEVKEESLVLNEDIKVETTVNVEVTMEAEDVLKVEKIEKVEDQETPDDGKEPEKIIGETVAEEQQKTSESPKKSPTASPSKLKNLSIASVPNTSIVNIVDLEDDSEDDSEVPSQLRKLLESKSGPPSKAATNVTTVNIPTTIEIMLTSSGNTSDILLKTGEVVITGLPKPPPHKPARLNTDEVTIKTASSTENTLVIPEAKVQPETRSKPLLGLEIFSLDSDDEEETSPAPPEPVKPPSPVRPKKKQKICINFSCPSGVTELKLADTSTTVFYDATKKKRPLVCQPCADAVLVRKQKLVEGLKNMSSLLELDINSKHDMVEILDSESDDDDSPSLEDEETIGEKTAEFLENNLADLFNKAWKDYKLDDRLLETQNILDVEIKKLERDSKEINQMLIDCQHTTDKLRNDFYASFEYRRKELPSLIIYDAPDYNYTGPEVETTVTPKIVEKRLLAKRKLSSGNEVAAKKPAIPLGYTPLGDKTKPQEKFDDNKADDDKDVSVVKLSAESAPPDLPPPGELSRPPLKVGMDVYAMKNAFGPWLSGKIMEILPKANGPSSFTLCRVRFDHKMKANGKILPARCIAYHDTADVRMTIGTRLIALFKDTRKKEDRKESFYSGVVAEVPNPVNDYRYLVFFDDGYAQYVSHPFTRVVCESSALVWEEVHPFSRDFVRDYLMAYPERPMVRLHEGQFLKTEWNGQWWPSRVLKVDASLAQVVFTSDGRREWIYRGSTRLAPLYLELKAAERHRVRPMPRSKHLRSNMPYVEYTRSDESPPKPQDNQLANSTLTIQQQNEEIRRQRAVAKKSTSLATATPLSAPPPANATSTPRTDFRSESDASASRVVYYTPKTAVRPHKMVPHTCSPSCKRTDVLTLNQLRTYNPLSKPLLSGWERQIVRFKGQREVMYRAPCGRRVRNMRELHKYLRATDSDLPVDLFDFYHATHCLAEFVMNRCIVGKKDLSHGKENVPVPCVNFYDESLPEFCSYNTERTPTSGVPLNLDPEFLCGCDCTDDCEDKTKCSCWQMTLEGARTIGLEGPNVGYTYKRLPEPLPSGIYECNSRCKCKNTCLNRVAQHPLQLKLQVFKTKRRGWGIRALNDVPKGAFLCVYAGNLLTDATANLDGLNEGDEYLAELDYIEVVEQMKEGYEEDIPEADKKLDKKESGKEESEAEESSSSEEDETASKTDKEDDDFRPGYIGLGVMEFNKRLRRRGKNKKEEESKGDDSQKDKESKEKQDKDKEKDSKDTKDNIEDDCITISDDEEVREPSRFAAQPGMGGNDFVSKYRSVRSYFGEDEACYIMDAKVQGNIGRYLNHSCSPNVFVQNVFVDTHDPRFPWVAFFALSHIKAGTELTWNYNYDVGSVPGKVLYCYCDAPNCRGRLL